jgi:alpha-tubulin suppressor-like RCC1 family protein
MTTGFKIGGIDFDDKYIRKSIFDQGNHYNWGLNNFGQLGDSSITHRSSPVQTVAGGINWKQTATSWYSTFGIKTDGRLWSWGYNTEGQLGDSTIVRKSSPVPVGSLQDWKTVSAGAYHVVASKIDGTIWSWGWNGEGHLGHGDLVNRSSPTIIGANTDWKIISAAYYHNIAIRNDGTMWGWGNNYIGECGTNTNTNRYSSPVIIGALTDWKDVACGGYFTIALKTDGTIWSYGRNNHGQLGVGDSVNRSSPTIIGANTDWKKVSAGGFNGLAIKTNGTLWVWGRNANGQVGDNSTTPKSSPVQTISGGTNWKLVAGADYSVFGLKTDGTLWSWGQGTAGRTGQGDIVHRSSPTQIGAADDWIAITIGGGGATRLVE